MQAKHTIDTAHQIATSTRIPEGAVALWWLGQASFALRSATSTILIDPFLTPMESRVVPPLFTAEECPPVDLILYTHEHIDHLDIPALKILAHHPSRPRFIAPSPIVDQVLAAGVEPEQLQGVQPEEDITIGGTRVIPLPALHGLSFPPVCYSFGQEISDGHYRYLGYVVELGGIRVYHPGDTLVFEGLTEKLQPLAVDLALLPINGRSYFREQQNLVGNMDEREAADLAAAAGIKAVIPTHYEMFAANVGRPGFFVDYIRATHPEVCCYLPSHGRRLIYMK
ncbi:MBL fold metallo-hydrolase [Dictyobacter aurantiacus]|uniref:MBL fold metallo-hydrolase n=1 Tax=Dictyobacter aurantiacus TaxID=1936993 RepID=A0A401ZS78_9CHLR|nr:MBL fold metallo-hydrolase [Dictyobacter aurantiacus]GCE09725.1 MBL fold metallo-hydrolase [Dictyobacter aurantiacus]